MLFCAKALVVTLLAVAAPFLKANAQTWAWATAVSQTTGGLGDVYSTSTATDASGNVYVVGTFYNTTISFGSTTLTSNGDYDFFWVKYDPSGNVLWAKSAGGGGTDEAKAVFTDNFGHVYFTGFFNSSHIVLGGLTMYKNDSTPGTSISQDFVVKCNASDGSCIWVKTTGSDLSSMNHGTCSAGLGGVDAAGNVYLAGQVDWGDAIIDGVTVSAIMGASIFFVKYDSTGTKQWVNTRASASGIVLNGCTVDHSGNIYLTGNENGPGNAYSFNIAEPNITSLYLFKYDASGGLVFENDFVNGYGNSRAVTTDNQGNVYVAGDIMLDTISFGGNTYGVTAEYRCWTRRCNGRHYRQNGSL